MATIEFTLPELGENVGSGDVIRVLVKPGDTVARDQPVLELETDKATIEVPSSVGGTVREVKVKEGDKVTVGQAVIVVEDKGAAPGDSAQATARPAAESRTRKAAMPVAAASSEDEGDATAEPESEASAAPKAAAAPAGPTSAGAIEFTLPELGENVPGGDVVRVLVKPGDTIQMDEPVLELETDKATIEVPSSVAGVVKEVRVKEGDKVKVGQVVFVAEGSAGGSRPAATSSVPTSTAASHPAASPTPGAKDDVRLGSPGGPTTEAQAPIDAETATGGLDQHVAGPIRRSSVDKPGVREDALAEAAADAAPRPKAEVVSIKRAARGATDAEAARPLVPAAPSVRRVARELGVDITQVAGSGPGGRISADDVKAYVKRFMSSGSRAAAAPASGVLEPAPLPDFSKWGEIERKPMRGVRRRTAERLSLAWSRVPHVTQFDKADITSLEELRKRFAKQAEAAGGKLTVTAIALKVVAAALKVFPQVNAAIDMDADEVVYRRYVHVGVAVDTERGLLVPVIRDADRKSVLQLAAELAQLSEKARSGKLTLEEMQGGCFTITNLGGIGGTGFTPIVNYPEVAILGMSRSAMEPVYVDGEFKPRLMLPLSLSYDHRALDGADAIRFLRWVCEAIEQPFLLSLQG
jgi:pyruvate dehydrogenase E2 component (dihydrolipoamide acetyltransferase)